MKFPFFSAKTTQDLYTIGFYNLENLFDTENHIHTLDDDFTPGGRKKWTPKRYRKKVRKLAKVISKLGCESTAIPPALLGIAEVENNRVIEDLLNQDALRKMPYAYVHFDSPDERGIDTGLIYHQDLFRVTHAEAIPLYVDNPDGQRDTTRDILYVKGVLNKEVVHFFVNHWPSRREGAELTSYKRVRAAQTVIGHMQQIEQDEGDPSYIVMGDFNDDPISESVTTLTEAKDLYNPMLKLFSPDRGSANYKENWSLFDQIMISRNFTAVAPGTHSFYNANIFDQHFITEWKGRFKGNPFRTYVGRKYLGGYSDHFPVYLQFKYHP